jgi:hypothetical protein
MAQHLTDEEGVTLRLAVQRRGQRSAARIQTLLGARLQERGDFRQGEAAQQQALKAALPAQGRQHLGQRMAPVEVGVAIGAHDEQPRCAELLHEKLKEHERGLIRPMQIVEHEQQRPRLGDIGQRLAHGVEQPKARRLGVKRRPLG